MSGAGDTDGEVSRDEAAWRDLIARLELPADPSQTRVPWPAREDLAGAADAGRDPAGPASSADQAGPRHSDSASPVADQVISPEQRQGRQAGPPAGPPWVGPGGSRGPADRTRVIRPAGDPRSYTPPEENDEQYIPAPLPPPARLDPISKAAVAGVVGGPGYLLVASVFLHWSVSPTAAFVAVAAFIGGFVTLVVKLGDRPRRGDDDDGAVL